MQPVLSTCSCVWFDTKVVCGFSVVELVGKDTILDQGFFADVETFIVDWVGSVTSTHGWVINNRDDVVPYLLTKFSIET